jgi:hypothetical protein
MEIRIKAVPTTARFRPVRTSMAENPLKDAGRGNDYTARRISSSRWWRHLHKQPKITNNADNRQGHLHTKASRYGR